MKKIKVGQVWADTVTGAYAATVGKVIVTHVSSYRRGIVVDYINSDGLCFCHDSPEFLTLNKKCIAEYPTWQEAVNSPEFQER